MLDHALAEQVSSAHEGLLHDIDHVGAWLQRAWSAISREYSRIGCAIVVDAHGHDLDIISELLQCQIRFQYLLDRGLRLRRHAELAASGPLVIQEDCCHGVVVDDFLHQRLADVAQAKVLGELFSSDHEVADAAE